MDLGLPLAVTIADIVLRLMGSGRCLTGSLIARPYGLNLPDSSGPDPSHTVHPDPSPAARSRFVKPPVINNKRE